MTLGLFQESLEELACCDAVAVLLPVLLPEPVTVTVTVGDDSALPLVVPRVVALTLPSEAMVHLPLAVIE